MDNTNGPRFFLGANSPGGFYSIYNDFCDPDTGDFLWVLKGGPGCGKSTFMKKIGLAAEAAGLDAEYIYCTGDPDSLDGLYIPALATGYVDGTSPHVLEARYPAAASMYLDLGAYYDSGALRGRLSKIAALNREYMEHYARAYAALLAAHAVSPRKVPGLFGEEEERIIRKRASGAVLRELGRGYKEEGAEPKNERRFLSAFTCKGTVFMEDTVKRLCGRVYTLDNDYGMAPLYLSVIAAAAKERGLGAILCPDPMEPESLEAVIIPEKSIGFLSVGSHREYSGEIYRHIRLDAIADSEKIRGLRPRLRASAKIGAELLGDAQESLAAAKKLHDELEEIYNPHVDFAGVRKLADEHISMLNID